MCFPRGPGYCSLRQPDREERTPRRSSESVAKLAGPGADVRWVQDHVMVVRPPSPEPVRWGPSSCSDGAPPELTGTKRTGKFEGLPRRLGPRLWVWLMVCV